MSHGTCPIVTIKVEPTKDNPKGELDINASDYDESKGMISVEKWTAMAKANAEAALAATPAEELHPKAEETSPAPDTVEAPKPAARVVEAEGKAEGRAQKKRG